MSESEKEKPCGACGIYTMYMMDVGLILLSEDKTDKQIITELKKIQTETLRKILKFEQLISDE